jgi:GTPase SAR1 family protein
MSVRETRQYDIPLKLPKMNADKLLDPDRSQLKEPLPNTHATWLFVGKPRSGKSTYCFSLISTKNKAYHKLFDHIHIVMPPDSRRSLQIKEVNSHKRVYDELTRDTLNEINDDIDELIEEKGKEGNSLIIYDDVGAAVKNNDVQGGTGGLQAMSWNFRHRSVSQFYLLQTLRSLPLPVRKVATILVIWNIGMVEQDLVYEEFMTFISKKQWEAITLHTYNVKKFGKHTCLWINTDEQKIYRLTENKYYLLEVD